MYITVYILTYQNLLLIYTGLTPENRQILYLYSSFFFFFYDMIVFTYCMYIESCLISCYILQFWKIFAFKSPDDTQFQSDFALSSWVSHESRSLFLGVWWHSGWLAVFDRGLSNEIEESSGGAFPKDEISRLQSVCDA